MSSSSHLDAACSREAFDARYLAEPDPWHFATSAQELDRYDALLEALGGRRFRRAFEPGCSIGVLTERLAGRCDRLVAMDLSPVAAERARRRCAERPQVEVRAGSLPLDVPMGTFDLVVFAEIGYYFTEAALGDVLGVLVERLEPGGVLVGTHWTGSSADHRIAGGRVHAVVDRHPGLRSTVVAAGPTFVLGAWERR